MKRLLFFVMGIVVALSGNFAIQEVQAWRSIPEVWTLTIEDTGVSRKLYFCAKVITDELDTEWHLFGVTQAEGLCPISTPDPVFEHGEVQFPRDFSELGQNKNDVLFDLAVQAGLNREGL